MYFNTYSIKVNSLSYKYSNTYVIKDISFSIRNGDILVIKGPNGSGKSTLLSLILGYLVPFKGTVTFNKKESFFKNKAYYLSNLLYINVYSILDKHLTVKENIEFWSKYYGYFFFIKAALFQSNIQGLYTREINTLSTGQERKANITQIFFGNSPIWILDEPFIALDKKYRSILLNNIKMHRKMGGIVIITSHLDFYIPKAKYLLLDSQ